MNQCFDIYQNDVTELERVAFHIDIVDPDAPANPEPEPDYFNPQSPGYKIPAELVRIHFGPGADQKEDFYDIRIHNSTLDGLGLRDIAIATQAGAQEALTSINDAIVKKDQIRAEFGGLQNRLENTQTNLAIQAENLANAESRLSDADIGKEMTEFVRGQVLTNTAVAMLGQANSLPRMILQLLGS